MFKPEDIPGAVTPVAPSAVASSASGTAPVATSAPAVPVAPAQPVSVPAAPAQPTQPAAAPATAPAQGPYNFSEILEGLANQLANWAQETTRFQDSAVLSTADLQGLAQVASAVKVPYDPTSAKTFQLTVSSTGSKFLRGPQIMRYAQTCCVVWDYLHVDPQTKKEYVRQHVAPLPPETAVTDAQWKLMSPNGETTYVEVLYNIRNFRFPFPLRLTGTPDPKKLADDLLIVGTFGELAPHLEDGSPLVIWPENTTPLTATHTTTITRKDGSSLYLVHCLNELGLPCRFFASDAAIVGVLPAVVTHKDGSLTVTPQNGGEPITMPAGGGNIDKLVTLPINVPHLITGAQLKRGSDRDSYVVELSSPAGPVGSYWAPSKLAGILKRIPSEAQLEATTGILVVTGLASRNGKSYPKLQSWLGTDLLNPLGLSMLLNSGIKLTAEQCAFLSQGLPEDAQAKLKTIVR